MSFEIRIFHNQYKNIRDSEFALNFKLGMKEKNNMDTCGNEKMPKNTTKKLQFNSIPIPCTKLKYSIDVYERKKKHEISRTIK